MKSTLKIILGWALTALFLFMPFASAQSVQNFDIEIEILGSKSIVSYELETDASQVQLNLPEDARILTSSANYSLENSLMTAEVKNNNISLIYETNDFIESNKYFTADFQIPETENLAVRLILPESVTLDKAYPSPKLTSDGKHIILGWQVENSKQSFPVFVVYNEKKELSLVIILVIASIILATFIFLLKRKPKKAKTRKKPVKPAKELHLLESESAVIKALKENKGELWQKQIQIKTGFSKAKLSRTIRNLEARNLVKRIPLGNTNKIKLK